MSESETSLHMQIAKYLHLADEARDKGNDELADTLIEAAARALIKLSELSAMVRAWAAEPQPVMQQQQIQPTPDE